MWATRAMRAGGHLGRCTCLPCGSERGDCEVDGDSCLRLHRMAILKVRPESPLPHGFLSSRGKNIGSAQNAQVLNLAIRTDERLDRHGPLYFHLPCQHRVRGCHGGLQRSRGSRRHIHALRSIGARRGNRLSEGQHGRRSRFGGRLHLNFQRSAVWLHETAFSTGDYLDVASGEAEWSLETLKALFDHYFVRPARTAALKAQLAAKLTP